MRVVAIVNQKGGCGKTTTAVNLAAVMARDGVRTLLVDMDPQSHCAAGLGVPDARIERTIADAMVAENTARNFSGNEKRFESFAIRHRNDESSDMPKMTCRAGWSHAPP
jgi:chromosome partitioning protein